MLEASRIARRSAALAAGGEGAVRVLPAATRLSLRVRGIPVPANSRHAEEPRSGVSKHAPPSSVLRDASLRDAPQHDEVNGPAHQLDGLPLAFPINRCAAAGDRLLARLGPDEWLLIGPEADTEAMAAEIGAALAGRFHALTDISHRQVALEVSGEGAADILNAGCPLDLHASAFPPGSATRTLLGKAEIVLARPGEAPLFRVECWRSFATYVHGFLQEAARDC